MPRLARVDVGNEIYHVINRANGRMKIFNASEDYPLFEKLIENGGQVPVLGLPGGFPSGILNSFFMRKGGSGTLCLFTHSNR